MLFTVSLEKHFDRMPRSGVEPSPATARMPL
jgi:hypothetical protein